MVLSTSPDKSDLYKSYYELCEKLELDPVISNHAWENFEAANRNFILEGDSLDWLCCAIYESACPLSRNTSTNLSFTNLLKHFNRSFGQFFANMRHWCDIRNPSDAFLEKINNLEGAVTVLCNVFDHYKSLYSKIFKSPVCSDFEQKQHKMRKPKPIACTPLKVFEFCWILFITIKNEEDSKKLVSLNHLLITVCDWAFKNAILANKRDLLNPDFAGLPSGWNSSDSRIEHVPCIISHLCPIESEVTHVKYLKEYRFKKSINELVKQKTLSGGNDEFSDVFDAMQFEKNCKNITAAYERRFKEQGEFDERILLAEYRRQLLEKQQSSKDEAPSASAPDSLKETSINQECLTPLTGRKYLGPRDGEGSPFSTSTESVASLAALLQGRKPESSDTLKALFETCTKSPSEKISGILSRLGNKFLSACQSEMANKRLQMSITLFYKLLENVLQNEKTIHNDISDIADKDVFYECMFACCLEIVLYSYKSTEKFPWVLDKLHIASYNFVKVIELIIRSRDKLARDTIKHLNMIEERILSAIVWKSDSLIWEAIKSSEKEVPKFEETALPGHIQVEPNNVDDSSAKSLVNSDMRFLQSPRPSALDRFQSPITHSSGATHLMIQDQNGLRVIPIVNSSENSKLLAQNQPKRPENPRPRRTGGLSILFRKFYNLSGERMEHLCTELGITDVEMKRKIWTAFEELVRKNSCELLKDRDLDQLLMCAVYVICKLTNTDKTFIDIIKSYKKQPQSRSEIYRCVLIAKTDDGEGQGQEERCDLIAFYNRVVIDAMCGFAQKFSEKTRPAETDLLMLSPLPTRAGHVVQVSDNIFVKPLEMSPSLGTGRVYNYYFSRSPSKDLKDINRAVEAGRVVNKRILNDTDSRLPSAKRIANRKVQSLIEERRNQTTE